MGRRARKVAEAGEDDASSGALLPLIDLVGLALIAIRWFTPTEGTFRGDTLWISQLWLGWGVLAAWSAMRQGDHWTRRKGLWTWGLLLLTVGHVVGGLAVVATEGQKRAALNGMWEWVSLGLAAVWFHQRASSSSFRRTFRIALIASAVGLSALGIWQRWVSHPALGRAVVEFDELEAKLPALEGRERISVETRLRKLGETIGPEYRELDAQGRQAMRQRLLESSEPLGRFALANSLAALLLVALCLAAGEAIVVWRERAAEPRTARFGLTAVALLIAFVFLLTKSRSAWAGGMAGGMVAAVLSAHGRLKTGLYLGGVLGLLVIVAAAAGGLDRQIVTEAKKSLEYRTEYWIGAWGVIQEHPLLGVGPGNFRQHYLAHKMAKSSEEVLDPHNFLLEAWATGGLTAIAGLVALIAAGLFAFRRAIALDPTATDVTAWRSSAPAILVIAGVLLAGSGWLLEGFADWELWGSLGLAVLAAIGLNRIVPVGPSAGGALAETATQAAWCALSVHLLGAGGMEMPAIIQMWLCLSSLVVAPRLARVDGAELYWPTWTPMAATAALLVATIGQGFTATRPSLTSRALVNLAQADGSTGARVERLDERLKDAARIDPVDPEPWRMRAQLALREWKRTHDETWFERAIESQREVIARDPRHAHDSRALAEMFLERVSFDHRPQDAEAAVDAARQALALYPNHLASRRTLALALDAAGKKEEAVQAARAAVELDALWLELAHYDKVLTADERARMKAMAGEGM
jgi:tetratricopeptide (TPR) repeat protein